MKTDWESAGVLCASSKYLSTFGIPQKLDTYGISTKHFFERKFFCSFLKSVIYTFQEVVLFLKSSTTSLPTSSLIITNDSFPMRYFMKFHFKGHQSYQKQKVLFSFIKSLYLHGHLVESLTS